MSNPGNYVPGAFSTGRPGNQSFYRIHQHGELDAVVDREGRDGGTKRARMVRLRRLDASQPWPDREDVKEAARQIARLDGCTALLDQDLDGNYQLRVVRRLGGESVDMCETVALGMAGTLRVNAHALAIWREIARRLAEDRPATGPDLDRLRSFLAR